MLELEPIEFFFRAIPEGFLVILTIYIFSNTTIDRKDYIITSLISTCMIFGVRALPVSYGVHTIINIGLVIILSVLKNKINTIKVIKSALIYAIFQLMAEGINMFIIERVLKEDVNIVFADPFKKSIYGIPSLIIVFFLIMSYQMFAKRKKRI